MRFPSGRASCGARAVLRALFGGVFVVLGLIAGGCGSTTYTYGTPVVTFSSTPGPFTAYLVQVTSVVLTRSDNTVVYPVITPEIVDFTKLNDMTDLFGTPALIEGTYVSATINLDYSVASIWSNVNGKPTAVTAVYDANATSSSGTTTAASTFSYTVKFENPLVIQRGVSTPIDFHFDLSASSVLDPSGTAVFVRPVLTASTRPVYSKPLRARGLFVTTDTANSNFTVNSRPFFDLASVSVGAVAIQTDANTTWNINGTVFTGSAGLTAMNGLAINTLVEAYGTLGNLNAVKPTFIATQVYAGTAVENLALYRATGTVASRTSTSLTLWGAEVEQPLSGTTTGVAVLFYPNITVSLGPNTLVRVDGQPDVPSSTDLISVGQQIDIEGGILLSSDGKTFVGIDATAGLVRLTPTTVWGVVTSASSATAGTANLVALGGYQPDSGIFTFTGTGSPTGIDSDPTNYQINNTSKVDLTTLTGTGGAAGPLVRFDGLVSPFGGAPPDFTASTVIKGSDSGDQLLIIDWTNGGSSTPFASVTSAGITVNMSDANVGTSHFVQTGPAYLNTTDTTVDLKNPVLNPRIVPADLSGSTGQYAIGNSTSTDGFQSFNTFAAFLNQVNTVLGAGTNKLQKLVAVGKWDGATFTATRIDMVQLP